MCGNSVGYPDIAIGPVAKDEEGNGGRFVSTFGGNKPRGGIGMGIPCGKGNIGMLFMGKLKDKGIFIDVFSDAKVGCVVEDCAKEKLFALFKSYLFTSSSKGANVKVLFD